MGAAVEERGSDEHARVAPSCSLISIPEAAARLGVARWTLYTLVRVGDLRAIRLNGGGRWSRIRLDPRDVERLVEQLAERRERRAEHDRRAIEAALAWDAHASQRGPSRKGYPSGRTRDRLAEMFRISTTAVQRARGVVVRDRALAEAVCRAQLSLSQAESLLRERERGAR